MGGFFESSQESVSTNKTKVPKYYNKQIQFLPQEARDIYEQTKGFDPFTGQRIADLTANEQQGIQGASNNYGMYQPLLDSAMSASSSLLNSGGLPTQQDLQGLMNPYLNMVLDPTIARLQEGLDTNLTSIGSMAGMSGAFGGSRQAVLEGSAMSGFQHDVAGVTGNAYKDAFDKALESFFKGQGTQQNNISSALQTALGGAQYNTQDINNLMGTGLTQRTREQGLMDFNFAEHMRENDEPMNDLTKFASLLYGFPTNLFDTTSTTTQTSTPSPFSQIAGVGLAAAGIASGNPAAALSLASGANSLGSSSGGYSQNGMPLQAPMRSAKGGLIKSFKKGGKVPYKLIDDEDKAASELLSDVPVNTPPVAKDFIIDDIYDALSYLYESPNKPQLLPDTKESAGPAPELNRLLDFLGMQDPKIRRDSRNRSMMQGVLQNKQYVAPPGKLDPNVEEALRTLLDEKFGTQGTVPTEAGFKKGGRVKPKGVSDPVADAKKWLKGRATSRLKKKFAEGGGISTSSDDVPFIENMIDPEEVFKLALTKHESGAKDYSKPNYQANAFKGKMNSHAFGIGQWQPNVWNTIAAKSKGMLTPITSEDIKNGNLPSPVEQEYAWDIWNKMLSKTQGDNYAMRFAEHQLGAGDLNKVRKADANDSMSKVVGSDIAKNVSAANETVGQYLSRLNKTIADARAWKKQQLVKEHVKDVSLLDELAASGNVKSVGTLDDDTLLDEMAMSRLSRKNNPTTVYRGNAKGPVNPLDVLGGETPEEKDDTDYLSSLLLGVTPIEKSNLKPLDDGRFVYGGAKTFGNSIPTNGGYKGGGYVKKLAGGGDVYNNKAINSLREMLGLTDPMDSIVDKYATPDSNTVNLPLSQKGYDRVVLPIRRDAEGNFIDDSPMYRDDNLLVNKRIDQNPGDAFFDEAWNKGLSDGANSDNLLGALDTAANGGGTEGGVASDANDALASQAATNKDALSQRMDALMSKMLDTYEKDRTEDPETFFGMKNVNMPLIKMGLALLANSNYPNSGLEALGKAGLSVLGEEKQDREKKVADKQAQFKEMINAQYMRSMIQNMSPEAKKQLTMQIEQMKEKGRNERAQASRDAAMQMLGIKASNDLSKTAITNSLAYANQFGNENVDEQSLIGFYNQALKGAGLPPLFGEDTTDDEIVNIE